MPPTSGQSRPRKGKVADSRKSVTLLRRPIGWIGAVIFGGFMAVIGTITVSWYSDPDIRLEVAHAFKQVTMTDSGGTVSGVASIWDPWRWCQLTSVKVGISGTNSIPSNVGPEGMWYLLLSNSGRAAAHNVTISLALPPGPDLHLLSDPRDDATLSTSGAVEGIAQRAGHISVAEVPPYSQRIMVLTQRLDSLAYARYLIQPPALAVTELSSSEQGPTSQVMYRTDPTPFIEIDNRVRSSVGGVHISTGFTIYPVADSLAYLRAFALLPHWYAGFADNPCPRTRSTLSSHGTTNHK